MQTGIHRVDSIRNLYHKQRATNPQFTVVLPQSLNLHAEIATLGLHTFHLLVHASSSPATHLTHSQSTSDVRRQNQHSRSHRSPDTHDQSKSPGPVTATHAHYPITFLVQRSQTLLLNILHKNGLQHLTLSSASILAEPVSP